ncbi:MAG TPA: arsenate reductase ArsC [Mariprofundaceae bacterium]|nr:arsenate reductase ArsC [Mariprofundaceae bacterium]
MSIRVLFLSRSNAARSQIAEYLLNDMGSGRFAASSAGNAPIAINPQAIIALGELGIDARNATSKSIELFKDDHFDYVINICDQSSSSCDNRRPDCPSLSGITSHGCWGFESSVGLMDQEEALQHLRKVRDQIANRLRVWMLAVDRS